MEPRCWLQLVYAIVYSISLSSLQLARSQFHASVCPHMPSCLCDRRVCWTIVSCLPKGASVEWQFATSSTFPTSQRSVFLDPEEEIGEHSLLLVKEHENPLVVSTGFPIVVPVLDFLQPNVKSVKVELFF